MVEASAKRAEGMLSAIGYLSKTWSFSNSSPFILFPIQNSPIDIDTISKGGLFQVYFIFSNFASALQTSINSGSKVKHLYAWGTFSDSSETMTAQYALVVLD